MGLRLHHATFLTFRAESCLFRENVFRSKKLHLLTVNGYKTNTDWFSKHNSRPMSCYKHIKPSPLLGSTSFPSLIEKVRRDSVLKNSILKNWFHSNANCCGRHWSDTLKDDMPRSEKQDPLSSGRASNPTPWDMEQELRAYRFEQEEKYKKFRPISAVYVTVGVIGGYIVVDSWRNYTKFRYRASPWMTPEKGAVLKPLQYAGFAVGFSIVLEIGEALVSTGAHFPVWTLAALGVGMGVSWILGYIMCW